MNGFDEVLDRVTDRLRVDPELRLEVRRELALHLEESAQEFAAAGLTGDEAQTKAIAAFGDPQQLAQQLWDANRSKIPGRKVIRFVGRYALAPAVAVASITLAWSALASIAVALVVVSGSPNTTTWDPGTRHLFNQVRQRLVAQLSSENRLAFEGNPSADLAADRVKPIVDRWPTDRMFYAQYAAETAARRHLIAGDDPFDRAQFEAAIAVIDRGAALEPENGLYPLLKSALLLGASSKQVRHDDNTNDLGFDFAFPHNRNQKRYTFGEAAVLDPAMFERGLEEFHKAAESTYIESYAIPLGQRRLAMLPPPRDLSERLMRYAFQFEVRLPYLGNGRSACMAAEDFAAALAQKGDGARAHRIARDGQRIGARLAERSHVVVETLTACNVFDLGLAAEAFAFDRLNDSKAFEQAKQKLSDQLEAQYIARHGDERRMNEMLKHAGFVLNRIFPSGARFSDDDLKPARIAEYAVSDQMAITIFAVILLIPIVAQWVVARMRGKPQPMVMFIGWRRLIRIVILAGIAPVVAYLAYVALFGARNLGIAPTRLAVEYSVVACAMVILMRVLGDRAMRDRARELGISLPTTLRDVRALAIIGAVMGLLVIAYLVLWQHELRGHKNVPWLVLPEGLFLAGGIVVYTLAWLRKPIGGDAAPRRPLGISFPAPSWIVLPIALALGAFWSVSLEIYRMIQWPSTLAMVVIAAVIAVPIAILMILVIRVLRRVMRWPQETAPRVRPAIPLGAAIAMTLLLVAGGAARWQEKRSVAQIDRGVLNWFDEAEHNQYRVLEQKLAAAR